MGLTRLMNAHAVAHPPLSLAESTPSFQCVNRYFTSKGKIGNLSRVLPQYRTEIRLLSQRRTMV
jgi:hypothetical protein